MNIIYLLNKKQKLKQKLQYNIQLKMKKSGISIKQLFDQEQRNKNQLAELMTVNFKNFKGDQFQRFLQKDQIYRQEMPIFCDMMNRINKKNINTESNYQFYDRRINKLITQIKQSQQIDLQKSIQYFYNLRIFAVLKSIDQLNEQNPKGRLQHQILFLEHLWKIFDIQIISGLNFRIILKNLININQDLLMNISKNINKEQEKIINLRKYWNILKFGQNQQNQHKITNIASERCRSSSKQNQKPKFLQTQRRKMNNMLSSNISRSHKNSVSNDQIQQLFTKISLNTLPSKKIFIEDKQNQIIQEEIKQNVHYMEKDVVKRLYKTAYIKQREQLKKIRDYERQLQQLKNCTFKPAILKKQFRQIDQNIKSVNGYQKAIQRLREGYYKFKQMKQIKEYIPRGENYEKIKKKQFNPPKFLQRKKSCPAEILFYIQLELGKKKVRVNIRENQSAQKIAHEISKIYHLNKQMTNELVQIINIEYDNFLSKANRHK